MGNSRENGRQIAAKVASVAEVARPGWLTLQFGAGTVAPSTLFHSPLEAAMTVKDPARPVARCASRLI